jgi:RNA recognition motif-containing protein
MSEESVLNSEFGQHSGDLQTCVLFIGNFPFDSTEHQLKSLIGQYGTVNALRIVLDKMTNRPRGFAFVEMADRAGANAAIAALNDSEFNGRQLRVSISNPKDGIPAGGGVVRPIRTSAAPGPYDPNPPRSFVGWKTQLCKFYPQGKCTYGESCNFIHSLEKEGDMLNAPPRPPTFRIPCKHYHSGFCSKGDNCNYSHDQSQPPSYSGYGSSSGYYSGYNSPQPYYPYSAPSYPPAPYSGYPPYSGPPAYSYGPPQGYGYPPQSYDGPPEQVHGGEAGEVGTGEFGNENTEGNGEIDQNENV